MKRKEEKPKRGAKVKAAAMDPAVKAQFLADPCFDFLLVLRL